MAESQTLIEALSQALQTAGRYNQDDQVPPVAILWPDKERQWEALLPDLRQRLPLLTFGPYAPGSARHRGVPARPSTAGRSAVQRRALDPQEWPRLDDCGIPAKH
jgi:hypothetical protein